MSQDQEIQAAAERVLQPRNSMREVSDYWLDSSGGKTDAVTLAKSYLAQPRDDGERVKLFEDVVDFMADAVNLASDREKEKYNMPIRFAVLETKLAEALQITPTPTK